MKNNLLLGVTGSIAASKTEKLHKLLSNDYNIKIVSTLEGLKYLSDSFKNNNRIIYSWDLEEGSPHIELSRWANKIVIYPATANFISKLNNGISDDILLATTLMYTDSIYIAPAMHEEMYLNEKTQNNILELSNKHIFCGPKYGKLDIGDEGLGRMLEPVELINIINKTKDKVIVTSGPTFEKIDLVRGITNSSSGKQGRAIAYELLSKGYDVIYIHSDLIKPVPHAKNIKYSTSDELYQNILSNITDVKSIYMTSAVSDFIPEQFDKKIDRENGELVLKLSPNIDIIKTIKSQYKDIKVIGFSAQIDNKLNFNKINAKNCDYLVINNLNENYFGSDNNKIYIIDKKKLIYESTLENKNIIAQHIIKNTVT